MKVALDPYMHRRLSLREVVHLAAELDYPFIELSPRTDFLPFFVHPRPDSDRISELKNALRETGVGLASLLPLYRWASPVEEERQAAVRYWKRAIQVAVEIECMTVNSELSGRADNQLGSEAAFWKSMDELLPIFESEGITLHLEPHPDDFIEHGNEAVELVRAIGSRSVRYLYCTPHTFHMGDDMVAMIRYAAPVLAHVHLADTLNHKASSGLRYIVNPPGSAARVHQHLNIGEGEIDWEVFFQTLQEVSFNGILTSCVFAWEERAVESSRFMREQVRRYMNV